MLFGACCILVARRAPLSRSFLMGPTFTWKSNPPRTTKLRADQRKRRVGGLFGRVEKFLSQPPWSRIFPSSTSGALIFEKVTSFKNCVLRMKTVPKCVWHSVYKTHFESRDLLSARAELKIAHSLQSCRMWPIFCSVCLSVVDCIKEPVYDKLLVPTSTKQMARMGLRNPWENQVKTILSCRLALTLSVDA